MSDMLGELRKVVFRMSSDVMYEGSNPNVVVYSYDNGDVRVPDTYKLALVKVNGYAAFKKTRCKVPESFVRNIMGRAFPRIPENEWVVDKQRVYLSEGPIQMKWKMLYEA